MATGFRLQALNDLASGPDYATNEILGNFHDDQFGSVGLELCTYGRHGFQHFAQDVSSSFFCLHQGLLHDLEGQAANFDIHLAGSDAFFRSGHFEVHVSQVVFVAQDVRQNRKTVFVGNQSHGDAAYRTGDFDTGVHQSQGTCAHGGHGAGSVGFQDVGNHADGVTHGLRHHALQSALGQVAVSNFAAAYAAQRTRFTGGEGREVVVQVEFLFAGQGWRIDAVGVQAGTQGYRGEGLGLAAGEQGAAVWAGQHIGFYPDGADFRGGTAVQTASVVQNLVAHGVVLHVVVVLFGQFAAGRLFLVG